MVQAGRIGMNKSGNSGQRMSRRRLWQLGFLIGLNPFVHRLLNIGAAASSRTRYVCAPILNCHYCPAALAACPIGVMAQASSIHIFPFVAVAILLVGAVLAGRLLCGWVCPIGFIQELVHKVPLPKFRTPKPFRYVKFFVLGLLVIGLPYALAEKSYGTAAYVCTYCPAGAMAWGLPGVLFGLDWPSLGALVVLGVVVLAMLFTFRPICSVLCPIGAVYSLANKISLFSIKVDREKCTGCSKCQDACPSGIGPLENPRDGECFYCLECLQCDHLKADFSRDYPAKSGASS